MRSLRYALVLPLCAALPVALSYAVQDGTGVSAQNDDAQEELEEILDEYGEQYNAWRSKLRGASAEERQKLFEEQPDTNVFAPRLLGLAKKYPKTDQAFQALSWILNRAPGSDAFATSIKTLTADFGDDARIGDLCLQLQRSTNEAVAAAIVHLSKESADRSVRGKATFTLAKQRQAAAKNDEANAEKLLAEFEELMDRVVQEYGDVSYYRGTLGDAAEGALFEHNNLRIGLIAPDIEGEDLDGTPFKLSDYRGKVVVIDFWGHW